MVGHVNERQHGPHIADTEEARGHRSQRPTQRISVHLCLEGICWCPADGGKLSRKLNQEPAALAHLCVTKLRTRVRALKRRAKR